MFDLILRYLDISISHKL